MISVLWVGLWLQLLFVPASWSRVVALALFGAACLDTIVFGAVMPRGAAPLLSSPAIGVLVLAAVSWTLLLGVAICYSIALGTIGPLAAVLLFGAPVSLLLAASGYLVLLVLLGAGRSIEWATRRPSRRDRRVAR